MRQMPSVACTREAEVGTEVGTEVVGRAATEEEETVVIEVDEEVGTEAEETGATEVEEGVEDVITTT